MILTKQKAFWFISIGLHLDFLCMIFCNNHSSLRYPYGQPWPVSPVCYLNFLLSDHESSGSPFRVTAGLPEQHGELHGLGIGHLPVQKCRLGHSDGSAHWLRLCNSADPALHAHLPLPQGKRGKRTHNGLLFVEFIWINT